MGDTFDTAVYRVMSPISAVLNLSVIAIVLSRKEARQTPANSLQANLATSNLLASITLSATTTLKNDQHACKIIAATILNFFLIASPSWVLANTTFSYLSVAYGKGYARRQWIFYQGYGWGCSFMLTLAICLVQLILAQGNVTEMVGMTPSFQQVTVLSNASINFATTIILYILMYLKVRQTMKSFDKLEVMENGTETKSYMMSMIQTSRRPSNESLQIATKTMTESSPGRSRAASSQCLHLAGSSYMRSSKQQLALLSKETDSVFIPSASSTPKLQLPKSASLGTIPAAASRPSSTRLVLKGVLVSSGFLISWGPLAFGQCFGGSKSLDLFIGLGGSLSGIWSALLFLLFYYTTSKNS